MVAKALASEASWGGGVRLGLMMEITFKLRFEKGVKSSSPRKDCARKDVAGKGNSI